LAAPRVARYTPWVIVHNLRPPSPASLDPETIRHVQTSRGYACFLPISGPRR
jgi:hypothetical protein